MQTSLIVVDDFLNNPHEVRERALQLEYPEQQGQFPGRNSLHRLEITGLTEVVSAIVGERLAPAPRPQSHGKCRITLAGDEGLGGVHIDASYWSGILYLSRPEDCRGGTEFFRHKETASDRFPLTREDLAATGFASFEEAQRGIAEAQGKDRGAWEHQMTVPMRFNRLVLLRPWLWHTAGEAFGDTPETGRLVYLMFFVRAAQG